MADMLSEMLAILTVIGAVAIMIIGGIMDMVDDYRQPHLVRARAAKRAAKMAAKLAKAEAPKLRMAKVTNRARRNARAFKRAMDNEATLRANIRAKRIEAVLAARGWGIGQ